jgi:nitrogen fixation NifU-like protein
MSDLRELYQEVILDHGKHPRNFRYPEGANHQAEGFNPLCGDRLTLKLKLEGDRIVDVGFQGSGCAISTASASTMTEAIKGKTLAEAEAMFQNFHALVTGDAPPDPDGLGKLAVFGGVAEFPMRVKCATLSWHTLRAALEDSSEPATTE